MYIEGDGGKYMANPILNNKFIEQERILEGQPMTINGTIQITMFLGVLLVLFAALVWSKYTSGYTDLAMMLTGIGVIGGFIAALIVAFTKNKILVPIYAALEGMALGGISATFEAEIPGIVVQAVAGTFAALFMMLFLYRQKIITCTDKFRSVIFITTASIAVIYLVDLIGSFFGLHVPLINSVSPLGILVSLVVTAVAALNLIIDFDFIERGAQAMLPKNYEWFGAFGLMLTLVWVYLEILRLLAKINKR